MDYIKGKTVLVTGASQGIGEAISRFFAKHGANVLLFARSRQKLTFLAEDIASHGGRAISVPGDVAVFSNINAAVQRAKDDFGGLDILVNNAGVIEPVARLAESDVDAWSQVVDINFKGVYHGLRAAIPVMQVAGGGTIINISSGAATGAMEGWSHYCSTKAAVLSLTRCVHKEYADSGICVVGLSPGTVATNMQNTIRNSGINPVSRLDPSAHIPPEWVAKAAGYLCGPAGPEFAGTDFSLKNNKGRQRIGLPLIKQE